MAKEMTGHVAEIQSFWDDPNSWSVNCRCGFEVAGLATKEAAKDALRGHFGQDTLYYPFGEPR